MARGPSPQVIAGALASGFVLFRAGSEPAGQHTEIVEYLVIIPTQFIVYTCVA